ncbi:LIM domain containing protein [Trichomonas vaginalis G3]|uniref:LIM domain containing protein n=1 Tax=Trichomonas vaginalis (strain ATCC PRA-98 / G3) TaxID=412133 RepID=A2DSM5_TRIV3|nr:uncharacterized protein TVAGG3_0376480 [Trichomonas vaginalis G3]EAY16605.1 LIM domain containing protein [Trichomonas vaginalis G3]KAI5532982.1 LIM domain containing protein family [Trichomonas vaginalis G3]|eukprot:XP_001328828.1 hypothetical protein [Trichomonas vaginalis G3]
MSGLPPPPMGGLPPPPAMGGLPPPPSSGFGGLQPPPGSGMGGLPPPPLGTGFGSGRGLPPPPGSGSGLPPPPGAGLPPPPSAGSGLPPPPSGGLPPPPAFGSNRGLPPPPGATSGLPPPPGNSGLPPPPMSTGLGSGCGLPPAPLGTGLPPSGSGLPPPPGAGLPPPPAGSFNSRPIAAPISTGLPPPPSSGLPPPLMSNSLASSANQPAPIGTSLPTGPSGLPPPPPGNMMPPPPASNFQSGRMAMTPPPNMMPPPLASSFNTGMGMAPPPPSMAFQSTMIPQNQTMAFQSQMMTSQAPPPPVTMSMGFGGGSQFNNANFKDDAPESSLLKTCKVCSKPCKNKYLYAFGNCYCPTCLKCYKCQKVLQPPECVMYKEQPICLGCAKINGKLNRCPICTDFLDDPDDIINLRDLNLTIHKDCLRCYECGTKLSESNYHVVMNQFCCESCKHIAAHRSCKKCDNPILGRYVFDRTHYFHVKCFTCYECDKQLNGKNFVVHHNRYYCPEQGIRYLKSCSYCKGEISLTEVNKIRWQNKFYHKRCFCCRICGRQLQPGEAICAHNRPHCKRCYDQRVKEGDVTESGRTPSNHNHRHKPEVSAQQRERFRKKFDDDTFYMPRYANQVEEVDAELFDSEEEHRSSKKHKHSSDSGEKKSSHKSHGSRRGHESHRGHKKESSSEDDDSSEKKEESSSSQEESSSSGGHKKRSHRSHRH